MSLHFFAEKIWCRLTRIFISQLQLPRILFYRSLSGGRVLGRPIRNQPLQTAGKGVIKFSGRVKFGVFPSPYFFSSYSYVEARNINARVVIGDGTAINNNFVAIAEHSSIDIGERVLIGANVEIFDSDFHGVEIADRSKSKAEWAKPVVIQSDVFLGSNVCILKGVTIGRGSIIANGSVVVKNIPSNVIAGGNPARVIRIIQA